MKPKLLPALLLLLYAIASFAQQDTALDTADYPRRKIFLERLEHNNEALARSVKNEYTGKTKIELIDFYNAFFEDFEKKVKNKDFLFDPEFESMVNGILVQLKNNNPEIPEDLKVLVAKDNMPNAYCLPDGTFIVNIGIFNWMDNEDQVAGILSHEIAHKILGHSLKSILKSIAEDQADRATMLRMRTLSGSANKSETAFELLKNRIYKKGTEQRHQEIEADSLGYILFKNSGYRKEAFLNALINLKNFDSISPRELEIATYKSLYDLPEQPFNDKWLEKEDFSLYNYDLYNEKLEKDSIVSHPEITTRIATLQTYFPELKNEVPFAKPGEAYAALQSIAANEILPNLYHSEDYGLGIYAAMQFLQDKRKEAYTKFWLGKMFEKIYEARKNYNLNRYLDRVNPKDQSDSYQQFLNFMWNLKLDEIKRIADHYLKESS